MARYTKPEEGEWVQPVMKGYKIACCDCGLVHRFDFRVAGKRIQFRAYRDQRATGAKRRHMRERRLARFTSPTQI